VIIIVSLVEKVYEWLKLKNWEFCVMIGESRKNFYAHIKGGDFNELMEIEFHEEDKRNRIINHKKDVKEFINNKVLVNSEPLLRSILLDLEYLLKGILKMN
jgi:hypothetical protein